MRKNIAIEIIASLLFLLFLYTGISKILIYDTFIFDLERDPLIGKANALLAAIAIPLIELLLVSLLAIEKTRKMALRISLILMVLFTIYVGIMIKSPIRHCTCGGVIREMSWKGHLIFNIGVTFLAAVAVYLNDFKQKNPSEINYKVKN